MREGSAVTSSRVPRPDYFLGRDRESCLFVAD